MTRYNVGSIVGFQQQQLQERYQPQVIGTGPPNIARIKRCLIKALHRDHPAIP